MRVVRPTVDEERALAIRRRADVWKVEGSITPEQRLAIDGALPAAWTSFGLLASIALFVLTMLAVGSAGWFVDMVLPFDANLVVAIAAVVLAELFVVRFRWWGTGIEHALWLSGLIALIVSLPGEGRVEVLLLFAAAAGAAGWRLRSAPLATLGSILVLVYLGIRGNDFLVWAVTFADVAVGVAIVTTVVVTAALRREWPRPSTELLLSLTLVVVPAGALVASGLWEQKFALARVAGALATVLIPAGLFLRHHAPLISGMILAAIAGADLVRSVRIVEEATLALFGAALLGTALIVSRVLRGRTRGVVITPAKLTVIDEAVETAASFAAAPHDAEAPQEQGPGGGGSFGGAGATDGY